MSLIKKITETGKKGFTLIELLVVISVIGVLSAFLYTGVITARRSAKKSATKMVLNQLHFAGEQYRHDIGVWPPANDETPRKPWETAEVAGEFARRGYIIPRKSNYDEGGNFLDSYGRRTHMSVMERGDTWKEKKFFNVWSTGSNGENENGKGDDITSSAGVYYESP